MNDLSTQLTKRRFQRPTKIVTVAIAAVAAVALPILGPIPTAQAHNDRHEDSERGGNPDALIGTWNVRVSIDPGTVPPGTPLNFTRLDTYSPGGVLVESNNGPGAGGPAGQGAWAFVGHHEFAATELRLGFDSTSTFTGTTKIRSNLKINRNGDEFNAEFVTDIYLPDGTELPLHPAGTFHGVRLHIEPLN